MDPTGLLEKYFPPTQKAFPILLRHSSLVAEKAVSIAQRLSEAVDSDFVYEAAMLHDIGICRTGASEIGCYGELPYICHGFTGREILESEGLPRHALVCERHIGVGLSASEIRQQKLPLPHRDMAPGSIEESIIAYADLFFSKSPGRGEEEKTPDEVRAALVRFGQEKVAVFDRWHGFFANRSQGPVEASIEVVGDSE